MAKLWIITIQTDDSIRPHSAYYTKQDAETAYDNLVKDLDGSFEVDGCYYYIGSVEAPKRTPKKSPFYKAFESLPQHIKEALEKYFKLKQTPGKNVYVKVGYEFCEIKSVHYTKLDSKPKKTIVETGLIDSAGYAHFIPVAAEDIDWSTLHASETPPKNDYSYLIEPDSKEGWLSPDGKFYGCAFQGHITMARKLFDSTEYDLELAGWLKITHEAFSENIVFRVYRHGKADRITSAQRKYLLSRPEADEWLQNIMMKGYLLND